MSELTTVPIGSIPAADLKYVVTALRRMACKPAEVRPRLENIHIWVRKDAIRFSATNTYGLLTAMAGTPADSQVGLECCVKPKDLLDAMTGHRGDVSLVADITEKGDVPFLTLSSQTCASSVAAATYAEIGVYPNIEKIVNVVYSGQSFTVDCDDVVAALKATPPHPDPKQYPSQWTDPIRPAYRVYFRLCRDHLKVWSAGTPGWVSRETWVRLADIPCEAHFLSETGPPLVLWGVNVNGVFAAFKGQRIRLTFQNDSLKNPIRVEPVDQARKGVSLLGEVMSAQWSVDPVEETTDA